MTSPPPATLADLPRDATARIAGVEGNDAVSRRLRDMGLLAGQIVRRAGTAPLGDPSIYFVRGFRLALRRTEACRVLLEPDSSESDLADRAVQRAHDPREAAAS